MKPLEHGDACPAVTCPWWGTCGYVPPRGRSWCSCKPCDCTGCQERTRRARELRHREERDGQLVMGLAA